MFVLVQESTEAVASSDVEVEDPGLAGDRFGYGVVILPQPYPLHAGSRGTAVGTSAPSTAPSVACAD